MSMIDLGGNALVCPACGGVFGQLSDSRDDERKGSHPEGHVICEDCGHVFYLNADGSTKEADRAELAKHPQAELMKADQARIVRWMIG